MKYEYFGDLEMLYGSVPTGQLSTVTTLFKQERDWTCSLACYRTLLHACGFGVSEDSLIDTCEIEPGPKCSEDIKKWAPILRCDRNMRYGCDNVFVNKKSATLLHELLQYYNVMIEVMINYAHWVVVLSYYKMGSLDDDVIVIYDPYYDKIRQFRASEIFAMWFGMGDRTRDRDYVAVAKK